MANLLRTSITARSTAVILSIVGVVGVGFISLAISLTRQQESTHQRVRLNELLDTVQQTVSIACFLSDKQLANEVAQGLLSNRTVSAVTIRAGNARLAHRSKTPAAGFDPASPSTFPPGALVRNIESPFTPGETVGEIALVPDAAEIQNNVFQASRSIALLLLVQIGLIGATLVVVVIRFIVRPISRISARLHELRAETGQKLDVPRGNETDEIGQLVRDVNAMVDYLVKILNEERALRIEREVEEKKFRAIFEHSDSGIFLVDESGLLNSWNPAFAHLFGIPESVAANLPSPMFMDLVGEHREDAGRLINQCIVEGKPAGRDFKLGGKAGIPTRWVNVLLSPVEDHRLQGVANDITEQKRAEEAAQELAATDRLTGLGNRLGFERKLEQMIDECYRDRAQRFAVLMLDLDWFKQVNDTYGHQAGDEVLAQVARRLEKAVRTSDFVGRLGGDEFVILLHATSKREIIERIAEKIISGIGEPIPIGGGNVARIGASIGAAVFEGGTLTKDDLIRHADEAMYHSKQSGRNRYRFYEDTVSV